jgi:general secretion pathway protein A
MNKLWMLVVVGAVCSSLAQAEVGIPAKGGWPEYLFIESVSREEAHDTATKIAQAIFAGRMVIFSQMSKLTDASIGDKGYTGDVFEKQWRAAIEHLLIDASPNQQRIMEKVLWAGKQAIDNNQDRLNVQGVSWKHFLPAKWEREMGSLLNARTGILTKQPARNYRNPVNVPDPTERETLARFIKPGFDGGPYGTFAQMGKQEVYRYMEPIRLIPPCMGCHGKPQGEPDMLGFEKDGMDVGDVIGLMSVTIAVRD